jgi:hypothetical protein
VQSAAFEGTTHGEWQKTSMPLTTLDAELRAVSPTLVKIDVEGYEHEALLGADTMLRDLRPTIFLELHLNYLNARHITSSSVIRLLTGRGYRLTDLSGAHRSEGDIGRSWASVLHLVAIPGDQ